MPIVSPSAVCSRWASTLSLSLDNDRLVNSASVVNAERQPTVDFSGLIGAWLCCFSREQMSSFLWRRQFFSPAVTWICLEISTVSGLVSSWSACSTVDFTVDAVAVVFEASNPSIFRPSRLCGLVFYSNSALCVCVGFHLSVSHRHSRQTPRMANVKRAPRTHHHQSIDFFYHQLPKVNICDTHTQFV